MRGHALDERDIEQYARRLANAMPDRPPIAPRRRHPFVVERVWREGPRYLALEVRVERHDFLEAHTRPGQYVTFEYGDVDPRFLVVASAPHRGQRWQFLIDRHTDLGEAVADVAAGDSVVLSPPEGDGFPADQVADSSVLMFTTGTGIASMRPVLQHWAAHPDCAPARRALYYGESAEADFAYVQEMAEWRARGVRIYQTVEHLGDPEQGYRYVQHAFEADAPGLDDARVFVSGAPVMMELIIAKLLRLGVPKDHIFINV